MCGHRNNQCFSLAQRYAFQLRSDLGKERRRWGSARVWRESGETR
jgi:hypothetical protein